MMKRCILFALLLALFLLPWAPAALGERYTVPGLFSVSYDGDVYTLDTDAYAEENTGENHRWFFILYNDAVMIDASMAKLDGYEGLSLTGADEAAQRAYVDDFIDWNGGEDTELVGACAADGRIPFYIFRCQDASGPYLMAETVQNGFAIDFLAYYNDAAQPPDDGLLTALRGLVSTFEPA